MPRHGRHRRREPRLQDADRRRHDARWSRHSSRRWLRAGRSGQCPPVRRDRTRWSSDKLVSQQRDDGGLCLTSACVVTSIGTGPRAAPAWSGPRRRPRAAPGLETAESLGGFGGARGHAVAAAARVELPSNVAQHAASRTRPGGCAACICGDRCRQHPERGVTALHNLGVMRQLTGSCGGRLRDRASHGMGT